MLEYIMSQHISPGRIVHTFFRRQHAQQHGTCPSHMHVPRCFTMRRAARAQHYMHHAQVDTPICNACAHTYGNTRCQTSRESGTLSGAFGALTARSSHCEHFDRRERVSEPSERNATIVRRSSATEMDANAEYELSCAHAQSDCLRAECVSECAPRRADEPCAKVRHGIVSHICGPCAARVNSVFGRTVHRTHLHAPPVRAHATHCQLFCRPP